MFLTSNLLQRHYFLLVEEETVVSCLGKANAAGLQRSGRSRAGAAEGRQRAPAAPTSAENPNSSVTPSTYTSIYRLHKTRYLLLILEAAFSASSRQNGTKLDACKAGGEVSASPRQHLWDPPALMCCPGCLGKARGDPLVTWLGPKAPFPHQLLAESPHCLSFAVPV